jgi:hypothetical protein
MKAEKPGSAPRESEAVVVPLGGHGSVDPESVSVDKIRDLLFGNQMHDYDRRFSNLEERFLQRFKEIESATTRLARSSSTQRNRWTCWPLSCEEKTSVDANKEIEPSCGAEPGSGKGIRSLSDQLNQFDATFPTLTREAQALREEIKQKNTDTRQMIEKMFAELSNVKTDRTLLASLFVEVAKCLNQDLGSKSVKGAGAERLSGLSAGTIMS